MKSIVTLLSMWFVLSCFSTNAQHKPTIDQLDTVKIMEDDPVKSVVLTGMTDGDAGTQTLDLTAVSDRPGFLSSLSFNYSESDTSIVFQPAADSCGIVNITITVKDQEDPVKDSVMIFAVEVDSVNDLPTIDQLADVVVNEDPLNGVVNVTLTGISAGPPNEPQGLMFSMYPVNQEMIDSMRIDYVTGDDEGILHIYVARDTSGISNIQISPIDDSGLFNDVSATFKLTVNPVNDAPTLDAIGDVTIENDEQQHVVDLNGISEGAPNETDQLLSFTVTTDNDALFDGELTVDHTEGEAEGQLLFTPASGASGSATVTVTVSDDGGTANGGVDEFTQQFEITVNTTPTTIKNISGSNLILYPNPVSDMLNVSLPDVTASGVAYEVYSLTGEKVSEGKGNSSSLQVPVSGMRSGWYQLKVILSNTVYVGRFLVK